jgi:hypothetical protein
LRRALVQLCFGNRLADSVGPVEPTPQVRQPTTLRAKWPIGRAGRFWRDGSPTDGTTTCACHDLSSTTLPVPKQAGDVLRLRR